MATRYRLEAHDGLTVFEGFGIRAGQHLPAMSFAFGLRERFPEHDPAAIADLLVEHELVSEDD